MTAQAMSKLTMSICSALRKYDSGKSGDSHSLVYPYLTTRVLLQLIVIPITHQEVLLVIQLHSKTYYHISFSWWTIIIQYQMMMTEGFPWTIYFLASVMNSEVWQYFTLAFLISVPFVKFHFASTSSEIKML